MTSLQARFQVPFSFQVSFTHEVFSAENPLLQNLIAPERESLRILAVFDRNLTQRLPDLVAHARAKCAEFAARFEVLEVEGGEQIKNHPQFVEEMHEKICQVELSRHSYVFAVGGGALLDAVGFAAATAHRGIRLIRFPTTTLSQADGGVGVKNGINFRGQKNFVGTFAPPFAVVNDFALLRTLPERDLRAGMIEAVKVGIIRDRPFFEWISSERESLARLEHEPLHRLIYECSRIHLEHICNGGDPFESGSSRPLDFGHWAAHKLEQLSEFRLRHGEAVAIGMAIDTLYSAEIGLCARSTAETILSLISLLGFPLRAPELARIEELLRGIEEFREHLGGELTLTMVRDIGDVVDVHSIDASIVAKCVGYLQEHCR